MSPFELSRHIWKVFKAFRTKSFESTEEIVTLLSLFRWKFGIIKKGTESNYKHCRQLSSQLSPLYEWVEIRKWQTAYSNFSANKMGWKIRIIEIKKAITIAEMHCDINSTENLGQDFLVKIFKTYLRRKMIQQLKQDVSNLEIDSNSILLKISIRRNTGCEHTWIPFLSLDKKWSEYFGKSQRDI